jgi:hypothetical protein
MRFADNAEWGRAARKRNLAQALNSSASSLRAETFAI